MKINAPFDPRLTGNSAARSTEPAGPVLPTEASRRAGATALNAAGDEATVSERARLMQQARSEYERTPEFRAETVALLREALAEGRYHVDTAGLADQLAHLVK